MNGRPDTLAARVRRGIILTGAALGLAVIMTWPLAAGMTALSRSTGGGDGLFSVWNVAWVARTIVLDPVHLFDANIFYPHRSTLVFSEANLGAGVLAAPAWWLTRNAYAAHNTAVLAAFATAFLGMWLLAHRLTNDALAATIAGCLFGFCPYLSSHTAHIQLLMGGGLPLSMLMLHRLADAPSPGRGVALGAALTAQALSCAYYGIFAALMVGYAVLFLATSRARWRHRPYWMAVGIAALVSLACVLPLFLPYLRLQQEQGFRRTLDDAVRYSANGQSYVASSAHLHYWMIEATPGWARWSEVLFPGFLAIGLGVAGFVLSLRRDTSGAARSSDRETALLYGSLGALAFWASFGPPAGLYSLLFRLPAFSFLHAPARFGLVVVLALAALAALALSRLFARRPRRWRVIMAAAIGAAAIAELNVLPFPWERAEPIPAIYTVLAKLPRGPVAEFPFYGERPVFHLHTQYMLFSTAHWMPLVNGYSDHFPDDFRQTAPVLASFPSRDTLLLLSRYRVRYIGIHCDMYGSRADEIRQRLQPFLQYLRPIAADSNMTLYEIIAFP
jgi:hypothetical protein